MKDWRGVSIEINCIVEIRSIHSDVWQHLVGTTATVCSIDPAPENGFPVLVSNSFGLFRFKPEELTVGRLVTEFRMAERVVNIQ